MGSNASRPAAPGALWRLPAGGGTGYVKRTRSALPPRLLWLLVAAGLGAPGCATHRLGLLVYDRTAADPPVVRSPDGAQTVIAARGDADPVRFLDGCIVELTGPMAFGVLHVRDWRVIDAGDGSGNFVGTLRAYGARLIIDDRNSGSPVILDDLTAAPLRPYVGYPVLVIGHVTGAGYVVPVAFRVLADVAR